MYVCAHSSYDTALPYIMCVCVWYRVESTKWKKNVRLYNLAKRCTRARSTYYNEQAKRNGINDEKKAYTLTTNPYTLNVTSFEVKTLNYSDFYLHFFFSIPLSVPFSVARFFTLVHRTILLLWFFASPLLSIFPNAWSPKHNSGDTTIPPIPKPNFNRH